jgi:hypothetical protein
MVHRVPGRIFLTAEDARKVTLRQGEEYIKEQKSSHYRGRYRIFSARAAARLTTIKGTIQVWGKGPYGTKQRIGQ